MSTRRLALLAGAAAFASLGAGCAPRDSYLLPSRHCPDGTKFVSSDLHHACFRAGVGLVGPMRGWWPNGQPRFVAQHRVGALEGALRLLEPPAEGRETGVVVVEAEYISGQRDGLFVVRTPEGETVQGQILDGRVVGRWMRRDHRGVVVAQATYDRNVCIEGDCGRTAGRLPAPFVDPVPGLPQCPASQPPPLPPAPAIPPQRCGPPDPWTVSLVIDPVGLPTQVVLDDAPASEAARACILDLVTTVQFPPPASIVPCRRTFRVDPRREADPIYAP